MGVDLPLRHHLVADRVNDLDVASATANCLIRFATSTERTGGGPLKLGVLPQLVPLWTCRTGRVGSSDRPVFGARVLGVSDRQLWDVPLPE